MRGRFTLRYGLRAAPAAVPEGRGGTLPTVALFVAYLVSPLEIGFHLATSVERTITERADAARAEPATKPEPAVAT